MSPLRALRIAIRKAVDFIARRTVVGPVPALLDMTVERDPSDPYRWVITHGRPTWAGQGIAECQRILDVVGLRAFRAEYQHEVLALEEGLFSDIDFRHCAWADVPWSELVTTEVWVDPAVTDKQNSDAHGIQIDALAADGTIYRLWSMERRMSPLRALRIAIRKAVDYQARLVGIETDQGGDTWYGEYRSAAAEEGEAQPPPMRGEKAGEGHGSKVHRASKMHMDYERGRIVHVINSENTHLILERALRRFPLRKPYDLVDASYWGWWSLRNQERYARHGDDTIPLTFNMVE